MVKIALCKKKKLFLLVTKSSPPSGGGSEKKKDTQPSQTCSKGYTSNATALYRGVFLFWGVLTRLDTVHSAPPLPSHSTSLASSHVSVSSR